MSKRVGHKVPVVSVRMVRDKTIRIPKKTCSCAADAAKILTELVGSSDREELVAIFLNAGNTVVGIHRASIGGSGSAYLESVPILRAAILACARGIVLGHNHPSGDVTPSKDDIETTAAFVKAADVLGIPCLDHVVVVYNGSFQSVLPHGPY